MTTLREAAQQALEALQNCANGEDDVLLTRDALANLRAALAEPVQEPQPLKRGTTGRCTRKVCECEKEGMGLECIYLEPVIDGYPLWSGMPKAEPVQEPVAWSYELATTMLEHGYDGWEHRITRYKPNVPEGSIRNLTPLYTAPPQRLPLTEEEIIDLWAGVSDPESPDISMIDFARAIERAHEIT